MNKKVNISAINSKMHFIYKDEREKNVAAIVIYNKDGKFFFDPEYKNEMTNLEVEALLLRGALVDRGGKYYRPSSFNENNVSFSDAVVNPEDIEVDLSGYVTKDELNAKANIEDIPTKLSDLQNDSNFLTSIPSEYVTETELNNKDFATKEYVESELDKIDLSGGETEIIVSDTLPSDDTKIWIKATEDSTIYPKIVLSSSLTYLNERDYFMMGIKLDNPPIEGTQIVDIASVNNMISLSVSKMMFTKDNYDVFQYVKMEHQVDNNITDDVDTVVFSTINDNYVELSIRLMDEGEADPYIYTALSSKTSGDGMSSTEGNIKNLQILGSTVEGVGLLNDDNTYTITICSSNGGTLAVGEKSTNYCVNATTVGHTATIGTGPNIASLKIPREKLPPIIYCGSSTNVGNQVWLVDNDDKLVWYSSTWGVQSPGIIDVPNDVAYAVFGNQQKTEWNNDSCFACWNAKGYYSEYGLIDSIIDKLEFVIPHPLRSNVDETVCDEIKYNSALNGWELITRIGDDGTVLDEETSYYITTQTKKTLSAYDGMTRIYMMEYGTYPLIKCDIPTSMDVSPAMLSLDDPQVMSTDMTTLEETVYDNGIYIKTENGFIPLQLNANNIKISNIFGYFNSRAVEGALNELYSKVNNVDLSAVTFNDIQGIVPMSKLPMESIKNDIGTNLEVTMISKLKGKNIVFDGDSITYGSFVDFTDGTYPTIVENQTGANITNISVPGDAFSDALDHMASINTAPDIITFLFGANDAMDNIPAGTIDDTQTDSIINRVKTIIDHCNTTYPNAKVVFMTTMPRKGFLGLIEQYRIAIINACRTYGAYCLDIHAQSGISLYTTDLETKWTNGDGCHYLQNAHNRIASLLINFLEGIV